MLPRRDLVNVRYNRHFTRGAGCRDVGDRGAGAGTGVGDRGTGAGTGVRDRDQVQVEVSGIRNTYQVPLAVPTWEGGCAKLKK